VQKKRADRKLTLSRTNFYRLYKEGSNEIVIFFLNPFEKLTTVIPKRIVALAIDTTALASEGRTSYFLLK
jgi:hypothetical protein